MAAGGGTEEHAFATVRQGGRSGDHGNYRVYGQGFERDASFNALGDAHDNWHNGQAGFRIDRGRPNAGCTLQGDYFTTTTGQRNIIADINNPPTFRRTNTANEVTHGGNLLARWTRGRSDDSNTIVQAYYDRFARQLQSGGADFAIDTIDIDFQHQAPRARHQFIYGAGYRARRILFHGSTDIDNAFTVGPGRIDSNRNIASAFVQDEARINRKLALTLGSKFEHNYYTGFEYQPTGRLLWTPNKKYSVWAAISRAVRTPNMVENDISVSSLTLPGTTTFFYAVPNTDLKSEVVIAHELGYRGQVSDRLSFDAALFYNKYSDLIGFLQGPFVAGPVPGTSLILVPYTNAGKANTYGIELASTFSPSPRWKLYGAYTYLKSAFHAYPTLTPLVRGAFEGSGGQSPRNQFYVRSSHDLPHGLQFDLIGRYVSKLPSFGTAVPSYITADARLAWKARENFELALVGQNLLNAHHAEFGIGPAQMQVERGLYGKITYQW